MSDPAHVVLYDGVCGLCNASVGFLLPRDPRGRLRFATLQGDFARGVLSGRPDAPTGDTVVVVAHPGTPRERLLTRGDAAAFLLRRLTGAWPVLGWLLSVIPGPFVNAVYDVVARNRYRWFGRHEACLAPPSGWQERFIDA